MSRLPLKITIEFDGAAYHGWQRQPGRRTVQGDLEKSFATVLREAVTVVGQGRTDAGVHAEAQTAHLLLAPAGIDLEDVRRRVNGILGPTCQIREAAWRTPGFHARFSALARHYRYQVVLGRSPLRGRTHWELKGGLDGEPIVRALAGCLGEHDFGMFCSHSRSEGHNRCVVGSFTLEMEGPVGRFRITADRFLHNMVRRLVGEMIWIGQGRRDADAFIGMLDQPGPAPSGNTAPAHGLVLERVAYPLEPADR